MKELLCRVEKVTSARNKDFLKALDIYSKNVPNNVKTEQNQLSQYVTKKYGKNKREMVFYVLYVGNTVIGYAEIGVLFTSKVFFIDYFIYLHFKCYPPFLISPPPDIFCVPRLSAPHSQSLRPYMWQMPAFQK